MFRKVLLATAAATAFAFASGTENSAEAGGPYGYRGGYSAYRIPSPVYRYPSYSSYRGSYYNDYHYVPRNPYYNDRLYGHRMSPYTPYGRPLGYHGSGFYYSSPGFSFRIGR